MLRLLTAVGLSVGMGGCALLSGDRAPSIATAEFLHQYATTQRFSLGSPRSFKFTPDGDALLFLRSGADDPTQDLYEFDVRTGSTRRLLTAQDILRGAVEQLSTEEKARRERMRLSARGIASYQMSKDGKRVLVPLSGRLFVIDRDSGAVTELASQFGNPIDPLFSPDGTKVSCVRDGELYVTDIASQTETKLTTRADEDVSHALAEFVAQEEMGRRHGYWWSPDSRFIAFQRTDTSNVERLHILDAVHPEKPSESWPYPRAGKTNADVTLAVVSVSGGEPIGVEWDRATYPYLATVKWPEGGGLHILVQNREQTEESLLAVHPETGRTSLVFTERDDAWINLDPSMPRFVRELSAFVWLTERNGFSQLELRGLDGRIIRELTGVASPARRVVHIDAERNAIYYVGGDDPTQTHLFRATLDGTGSPVKVSETDGMHSAVFSRKGQVYLHTSRSVDGQTRRRVVDVINGRELGTLESIGASPGFVPNVEWTMTESEPSLHAAIIRPRNFSSWRRYPVIVYVYGGPKHQTVRANPQSYLLQQWIADHGFVVVTMDARGTPYRGRDWERIIKNNVIDIPLDDQVNGLLALGRRYRELDLDRVGIYGWSFGGYFSAMAATRRPDIFDAGVAGAPVADWADYDTHYTERFMGLPENNADGYEKSSVLTYCDQLRVPLLIIHGTADDNVYFMHSLKMSDALFRAGKQHELLVLSDFTHMVRDPLVTTRLYERIVSFFESHLGGT
jgi:dipeptidyl-peptidase 4